MHKRNRSTSRAVAYSPLIRWWRTSRGQRSEDVQAVRAGWEKRMSQVEKAWRLPRRTDTIKKEGMGGL